MLIIKYINFIYTSYILKQVTPNVLHFWLERLRGVDMRLFDFITVMLFTERINQDTPCNMHGAF